MSWIPRWVCMSVMLLALGCQPSGSAEDEVEEMPVLTVASTTQVARINDALPDSLSITRAYAVRSRSHAWSHYIAAKVRGGMLTDSIGIWFMEDGMDVPGAAFAVNGLARSISSLPPFEDVTPEQIDQHHEIVELRTFTRSRP